MNCTLMLDTHVLLRYLDAAAKLSTHIRDRIGISLNNGEAMISTITLWEISMLKSRNRISIFQRTEDFLEAITNIKGLTVINITPKIATQATSLPDNFHKDPSDRMIVATTICNNATLITSDSQIIKWANKYGHMKVLEG